MLNHSRFHNYNQNDHSSQDGILRLQKPTAVEPVLNDTRMERCTIFTTMIVRENFKNSTTIHVLHIYFERYSALQNTFFRTIVGCQSKQVLPYKLGS